VSRSTVTDLTYLQHIDPLGKESGFDSPLVSVSSQLWWIVRLALKEMNNGAVNGRISVIDAGAMDPRSVFHALPCKSSRMPYD
jgi:hypothetical protein